MEVFGFKMFWRRLKKDKAALLGLFLVTVAFILAILAPFLVPYDPYSQDLTLRRAAPSVEHLLGLDPYGRDILSRLLYGASNTLAAALVCVSMSLVIGILLGFISGYFEGRLGAVIMRLMDVILAFPYFILAILIVAVLGPGLKNAILAVAIVNIPRYARVTRSSTLTVKNLLFIEAARALGADDRWIIINHILPNSLSPIIVLSTLGIASAIISVAALSFIGLGAQPPIAEWGLMLSEGRSYISSAPHICIFPGLCIVLVVLGFNLLGDGLRDCLDPRLR